MDKDEFWIRLLMVKGLRLANLRRLSGRIVANASQVEPLLFQLGMNDKQRQAFYQVDEVYLITALDWLEIPGNLLVTYTDSDYPGLLRHIKDPPIVLFVSGDVNQLNNPQIAMVGSRRYSYYGEHWGRYFATELVHSGFSITSGLALGIDAICHRAALDAGGITMAVLGSGLAAITPRSHQQLAERILTQNGVLVSEFLPSVSAIPEYFPKRNRIISGLSQGVLIVEAALRSGSLITARCALEQGREVFALPGPLGNNGYQGTHWLIQQGANLVAKPADIIEYLNSSLKWLSEVDFSLPEENETTQVCLPFRELLNCIGDEVTPLDVIIERSGISVADISVQLLELELSGHVVAVEGGYVQIRTRLENISQTADEF